MPIDRKVPATLAGDAELVEAWRDFCEHHDALAAQIEAALANDSLVFQITLDSGDHVGTVHARDFAFRFPRLEWSVQQFDPANSGLGATASVFTDGAWTGAKATILPDGVKRFAAWRDVGLNYLALHETAHTTPLGVATNEACYRAWLKKRKGAYDSKNPLWIRNEKVANNIARAVAKHLELDWFQSAGAGHMGQTGGEPMSLFSALEALEHPPH